MDVYMNHLSIAAKTERIEAYRREKEAKRQEWVETGKYFQKCEANVQFHNKLVSAETYDASMKAAFSGNPPSTRIRLEPGQQDPRLVARRNKLKAMLQSEEASYSKELLTIGRDRPRPPQGTTKDEVAAKLSDDYSNRNAFLSNTEMASRRKHELTHFRIFPNASE